MGITCSYPFLVVRIIYSVLSSFAPKSTLTAEGFTNSGGALSAFSSFGGSWVPFFVMGILMEFIVICIYIYFGLTLPISSGDDKRQQVDYERTKLGSSDSYEMRA